MVTVITADSEINFNQFKSVSTAFVILTSSLTRLLRKADFHLIRRSCIEQINTVNGAQLLPEDVTSIKASKNIDELLDVLAMSAYWSWIDVRLLQAMAAASDNMNAMNLIERYKNSIFKKKLKDVLPDAPGKEVKEAYYTKIVSLINKDPNDIIVEDLLKFQAQLETVIMDIKNGVCILEHLEHLAPSPPVNAGKLCNIIVLSCVLLFCHITTMKDFIEHYHT